MGGLLTYGLGNDQEPYDTPLPVPATPGRLDRIEAAVGATNGVNRDFDAPTEFVPGSTVLWLNGQLLWPRSRWAEVGPKTIRLQFDIETGERLKIGYLELNPVVVPTPPVPPVPVIPVTPAVPGVLTALHQAIGLTDGVNRDFSTPTRYLATSLQVWLEGDMLPASEHQELSDSTFRLDVAPQVGDIVIVGYYEIDPVPVAPLLIPPPPQVPVVLPPGSGDIVEQVAGATNGQNRDFTTTRPFVPASLRVFWQGVMLAPLYFTITVPQSFKLTFSPDPGETISAYYRIA